MFSSRAFGTAHSSPAPSCRSSRSRSGKAGSGCRGCAMVLLSLCWVVAAPERPMETPAGRAPRASGCAVIINNSILPRGAAGHARQMAGMLRHSHGGTDGLGRSVCPEGKPAGNIAAGHRLPWPGARSGERQDTGVSTHLARAPLHTRLLGLGSAAYPVSDIQTPGSRDVLCLRPSGGEGLPVQAGLSPSSAGLGQSWRGSFPNTSFCPLLTCETPTRGGS